MKRRAESGPHEAPVISSDKLYTELFDLIPGACLFTIIEPASQSDAMELGSQQDHVVKDVLQSIMSSNKVGELRSIQESKIISMTGYKTEKRTTSNLQVEMRNNTEDRIRTYKMGRTLKILHYYSHQIFALFNVRNQCYRYHYRNILRKLPALLMR